MNKTKIDWADYSVNPVKGICPNNCWYYVSGDTYILKSNSAWVRMKNLKVGEKLIGIRKINGRNKFVESKILNKWSIKKEAMEIFFDNKKSNDFIICSLDHKFLTADHNRWLSANKINLNTRIESINTDIYNLLESADYKNGYLAGLIDGDGTMNIYSRNHNKTDIFIYSFRIVMKDYEAIKRAIDYFQYFDIKVDYFKFKNGYKLLPAIRVADKKRWNRIKNLIRWENNPEFLRGYLGGIFDAEGSVGDDRRSYIRIYNNSEIILNKIKKCLDNFNFSYKEEKDCIRLLADRGEKIRFFNIYNPAINRKRKILINRNIWGRANILGIKRIGIHNLYDIETETGNFIANGLIAHNCYARRMYKRFKWNPITRLDLKCLDKIEKIKKPSKIFVGSMHDIFGLWIPNWWIQSIIEKIEKYKKHTFIFLTKYPVRYQYFDFPENCWLGLTITGEEENHEILTKYRELDNVENRKNIKFISYEPILKMPYCFYKYIDWVIIGGLTGHKYKRPDQAINEIILWCISENIPIFIKNNLNWIFDLKEFPKFN